ncbi:MAG: MotA/TolQ/ExbB proton channel family protein [Saprospiraceae bacterium]
MSQQTVSVEAPELKKGGNFNLSALVIPIALIAGYLFWQYVCGNPANFEGGNPAGHAKQGNYLGIVYKGGFIVPILMGLFLVVVIFSVERFLTLARAKGVGSIPNFVRRIKFYLESSNTAAAIEECDKQKGSVANVVRAGLERYEEMEKDVHVDTDQRVLAIRQEIEEATALELPMLERNLPILATITSVGTLVALLGTVLGMIRAFAALATQGNPDAVALSQGISEALINTALGISTSVVAMIMYNYFTGRIDKLTYAIDEMSYSIATTFNAKHLSETRFKASK